MRTTSYEPTSAKPVTGRYLGNTMCSQSSSYNQFLKVRISRSQFSYLNGTESFTEGGHVEPIEHEVGLEQLPGPETMLEIMSMRSLSLVVFCT